jgi:hypothetical protein
MGNRVEAAKRRPAVAWGVSPRGWDALDKELQQLVSESELRRLADKLFKF